jgi:multiple sugar transport system substrate-binding protein
LQEKTGIAGVAIPYGKSNGQNLMVWYNFLWGAGADLFDEKLKPVFNSEKGLKATQDYVDLMLKHKITPTGSASFVEQDAVGSFVQGKSAMVPVWWHVYNRFTGKDSAVTHAQVGFVPLPSYPGTQPTTYTNNWIYGVNKHSKNLNAALEFLTWVSQPDIERSVLLDPSENEVVATHWSNLRDQEVNKRFNGMHNIAAAALEKTKSIPNIPEFLPVVDVLEVAMSNIATGQASVPDAMNGAASQVARIMRRAG